MTDIIGNMKEEYKNIYKFKKTKIRRFEFYINKENEELIKYLESVPNRQAYIVELIEKDMKKKKQ